MQLIDMRTGLERLDHDECLRLLRSDEVGRLAIVDFGSPTIFPSTTSWTASRRCSAPTPAPSSTTVLARGRASRSTRSTARLAAGGA